MQNNISRILKHALLLVIILICERTVLPQSNISESASGFLTSMPPEVPLLSGPADQSSDLPVSIKLHWFSQIHTSSF